MKKTILKTAVMLLTAMSIVSCSKDGATGPAGPTGAAGVNGNANVIGTTTVTVPTSNWTSANGNTTWSTIINSPAITQAIVDKGAVSVFFQSGNEWVALPVSNPQNHYFIDYGFTLGSVDIGLVSESGYTISSPGIYTFRVVAISASNKIANPNTNWKDYQQVKSVLHLQD